MNIDAPANPRATPRPWTEDRLNRKQAADYLGVTEGTLAVWASTKRYGLPYARVGSRVYYRRTDLDAFILRRTIT